MAIHEVLRKFYLRKKASNPRMSVRLLAKHLKVSPAQASMILSGQRTPSLSLLEAFHEILDIDPETQVQLRKMVLEYKNRDYRKEDVFLLKQSPSQEVQDEFSAENAQSEDFVLATKKQFVALKSWHYLAITQTMLLKEYDGTPRYIANFLGLGLPFVESCLAELLDAQLVGRDEEGAYFKLNPRNEFQSKDRSRLTTWHLSNLEDTLKALRGDKKNNHPQERLVMGSCISCATSKLPLIRVKVADFLRELMVFAEGEDHDEVCRVSVQILPLSATPKGKVPDSE